MRQNKTAAKSDELYVREKVLPTCICKLSDVYAYGIITGLLITRRMDI
jgi:hypothetical protein